MAATYSGCTYDPDGDSVLLQVDWDDGSLSNWSDSVGANISVVFTHAWDATSTYHVRLRAQDEHGAMTNWSAPCIVVVSEATMSNVSPLIIINVSENVSANQTILFDASGDFDDEITIVSYLWDFGDGTTGTIKNPAHFYANPGQYEVLLLVVDSQGNQFRKTLLVTVSAAQQQANEQQSNILLYLGIACGGLLLGVCFFMVLQKKHRPFVTSRNPGEKSMSIPYEKELFTDVDVGVDLLTPTNLTTKYHADISPADIEGKVDTLLQSKPKGKK
jgi:PKD repeat protein